MTSSWKQGNQGIAADRTISLDHSFMSWLQSAARDSARYCVVFSWWPGAYLAPWHMHRYFIIIIYFKVFGLISHCINKKNEHHHWCPWETLDSHVHVKALKTRRALKTPIDCFYAISLGIGKDGPFVSVLFRHINVRSGCCFINLISYCYNVTTDA